MTYSPRNVAVRVWVTESSECALYIKCIWCVIMVWLLAYKYAALLILANVEYSLHGCGLLEGGRCNHLLAPVDKHDFTHPA